MNSSLRRLLIFIIMVSTGTVLILFDLPLLFIIALAAAIGFLLLVLLSPSTASEIKRSILNMDKISFIRRQKSNKTYIKIAEQKGAEPQKTIEFKVEPFETTHTQSPDGKKDFSLNLSSIASSFKSLGTILRTRTKPQGDTTGEIGTLPDTTVSKKVNVSALARAGELSQDSMKADTVGSGGMGGSSAKGGSSPSYANDPFLSLSSDELETGLLDTFDEENKTGTGIKPDSPPPDLTPPYVPGSSGVTIGESDIPIPPQEVSMEAQEQPASEEPDLEEFNGLEGTDTIDQNLDELDTIDFDAVKLDGDMWEEEPATATASLPALPQEMTPAPEVQDTRGPTAPAGSPSMVPGMIQRVGDRSDMTVFTAPPSADDVMISSLAADIKTTKKAKDISLLRDLKDLKVPAKDIEKELSELYIGLSTIEDRKSKTKPS